MRLLHRRVLGAAGAITAFVVACGTADLGDTTMPPPGDEAGAEAGTPTDATTDGNAVDATTDALHDAGADADADATTDATPDGPPPPTPPNILLVIGDDMGLDASVCHAVGADPGRAPRIQALCASGVVFDNVWSAPVCSPTRATILTGRYGFRNKVGTVGQPLPLTERALPKALVAGNAAYAVGAFGKWHLSTPANGGANHPNNVGFTQYAGSLPAQVPNYFNWGRTVNGVTATSTTYATTAVVDDARDWINTRTGPWFAWLAFNAPHAPYHVPPAALTTYVGLPPLPPPTLDHYHAMLEAMDTELGRLLDGLTPAARANTWIVFVGDNGTPSEVSQLPGAAKGSLYQPGIQVPMVVTGPGVVAGGRHVTALVNTVDIFRTVLELANVDMLKALPPGGNTVDAVSLVPYLVSANQAPLRTHVMSEVFGGAPFDGGKLGKTIRDDGYKLIRFDDGTLELYDLVNDPSEGTNLLDAPLDPIAEAHQQSLTAALDALLASP